MNATPKKGVNCEWFLSILDIVYALYSMPIYMLSNI